LIDGLKGVGLVDRKKLGVFAFEVYQEILKRFCMGLGIETELYHSLLKERYGE